MADDKNIIKTVIEFLVDKASLNKAKRGYDELEEKAKNSDKETKKQIRSVQDLGDEFARLGKQGADSIKKIGTEYNKLEKLDDNLQKRLRDRNEDFNRLSENVGLAGDVQSNLGAVQGLADTAGLGGVSQGIGVAGELAVLTEELPRLKLALQGMPDVLRTTVSSLGAKGVGLVGALGALTVALALATAEAQRRAQAARVVLDSQKEYFNIIEQGTSESISAQREQAQIQADIARSELEARKAQREQINQDIGNLTGVFQGVVQLGISAGITGGEVKELDTEIANLEKQLLENELAVQNFDKALESAEVQANDTARAIEQSDLALIGQIDKLGEVRRFENDALNNSVESNQDLLDSLTSQNDILSEQIIKLKEQGQGTDAVNEKIKQLTTEFDRNQESIAFLRDTAIPATQAVQDEADAIKALEENSKKAQESDRERATVLDKVNQLQDRANSLIAQFAEREADYQRKRSDDIQDFNIKQQQASEDHQRKLLDIQDKGNDRLVDLNQDLDNLQQDYFQEQVQLQRDYADELKSIDEQRNLERIQREREGANALDELASENNVIAFLREKRKQDSERQLESENQSLEDRQRAREFNEQRQQQEQAFNQQRELINRRIAEEKRAIQESIEAEKRQFEIQQQRDKQAFDLQQERAKRELDLERQKTQQQLALIQQKAQAEVSAVGGTFAQVRILQQAVDQLGRSVANFASSARNAGSSASSATRSLFGSTRIGNKSYEQSGRVRAVSTASALAETKQLGRRVAVAFANGGIVSRPTVGLLGEKSGFNEALIPFRPSEGIKPALERAGMDATSNVNLTINATVGENASVSEVKNLINQAVQQSELKVIRGVAGGITRGRFNASN